MGRLDSLLPRGAGCTVAADRPGEGGLVSLPLQGQEAALPEELQMAALEAMPSSSETWKQPLCLLRALSLAS